MPGRSPNWKHWDEAATLAGKFGAGEGERLQSLLDNVAASGHAMADDAWDALATFAIGSKRPGVLTMTMLARAADGISYHVLAECLLTAQHTKSPLALVLRDLQLPPDVYEKPEPKPRFTHGADRDWRKLLRAAPDFVGEAVQEMKQREWRSSDARPVARY